MICCFLLLETSAVWSRSRESGSKKNVATFLIIGALRRNPLAAGDHIGAEHCNETKLTTSLPSHNLPGKPVTGGQQFYFAKNIDKPCCLLQREVVNKMFTALTPMSLVN